MTRVKELYDSDALSVSLYDVQEQASPGSPVYGDVAFYAAQARRTRGPVLELGVGTGRVALALAEKGCRVTGLDRSAHMLKVARSKLSPELRKRVRLVRGDMARFGLGRRFGLILIPFRAFQHLKNPKQQRACLDCCRRHLRRGGRLIVDLFDPKLDYCLPPPHKAPGWSWKRRVPGTGMRVSAAARDRRADPLTQTFTETWVSELRDRRGKLLRRDRERLSLRWTYRWEMRWLLELSGLRVLACRGDFQGGRPRYGAEQVWVATPA